MLIIKYLANEVADEDEAVRGAIEVDIAEKLEQLVEAAVNIAHDHLTPWAHCIPHNCNLMLSRCLSRVVHSERMITVLGRVSLFLVEIDDSTPPKQLPVKLLETNIIEI